MSAAVIKNRITIFKHLSIDEIDNSVNMTIFENLLDSHYHEFVKFCDKIKQSCDNIESVTCFIENGVLNFDLKYEEEK